MCLHFYLVWTLTNIHYVGNEVDTCADVNIMPPSVYRLVFQDPNMKMLALMKHNTRMAKFNQTSTSSSTTILDI